MEVSYGRFKIWKSDLLFRLQTGAEPQNGSSVQGTDRRGFGYSGKGRVSVYPDV